MRTKRWIVFAVFLFLTSVCLSTLASKNVMTQAKAMQPGAVLVKRADPKSSTSNSCFLLDKQAEKQWRALNAGIQPAGYLYPAEQNNKWGFIDGEGKFKISPQYDYVTLFSPSGTAVCGNYKKDHENTYTSAKIIDLGGNTLLDGIVIAGFEVGYPSGAQLFDEYFAVFQLENGKNVIVDQTGKTIYSTSKDLGAYSEGFVAEGNSAYIDVSKLLSGKGNFKLTLPKQYKGILNFYHQYAALQVDDETTEYVDQKGKIYGKLPEGHNELLNQNNFMADEMHDRFYASEAELGEDGYQIIKKQHNENTSYGIAGIDGKELLKAQYDGVKYLGEGMFAIGQSDYEYGEYHTHEYKLIFDARNCKLYKVHYYMLQRYYGGVAAASDLKSSFFIDREGRRAKGYPVFSKVGQLVRIGGYIMQNVHGKVSYYQRNGIVIYSPKNATTILRGKMGYNSVSTYRRYDFGLEYPVFFGFPNAAAEQKINKAVQKLNEAIFNRITADDPKLSDYDIFYDRAEVTLNDNLLLVKYAVSTNGGGTLCIPYIMSMYFDIRTGQSYDVGSLFRKGIDYKKALVEKVVELYDQKKLLELLWSQGDLKELEQYLLDGNFYIAKDGLILTEFPDGSSNHIISWEELKIPYGDIMNRINTESELWNSFGAGK